jgi:hypothetical protein
VLSICVVHMYVAFHFQAYDKVEEKCCAERIPRYFVFVLDNTHSAFRSKTMVYDVMISDASFEESEIECVERYQCSLSYQHEQQSKQVENVQSSNDMIRDTHSTIDNDNDNDNGHDHDNEYKHDDHNSINDTPAYVENSTGHHSTDTSAQYNGNLDARDVEKGWGFYYDEEGNPYYYNHITEISQWEHPSAEASSSHAHEEEERQEQKQVLLPEMQRQKQMRGEQEEEEKQEEEEGSGMFTDGDSSSFDQELDDQSPHDGSSLLVDLVTLSSIGKQGVTGNNR